MSGFQVPVTLDSANRRKDRSVSYRLSSMTEISNQDFAETDKRVGAHGWLTFTEGEKAPDEVMVPTALPSEGKSPSVRLRAVMHVWWVQQGSAGDSETFYRTKMEAIISQIKDKLV